MKTILYIFFVILIISCKKDEVEKENNPPKAFDVDVATRASVSAYLDWTTSVDPDSAAVTYAVELGGKQLVTGLTTTKYKLTGLLPDATYQGKVTATDAKGLSTTADFQVLPHGEQILVTRFYFSGGLTSHEGDGAFLWRLGREFSGVPVISGDTIFVGADELFAVDANDGKILWANADAPDQASRTAALYYQGKLFYIGSTRIDFVTSPRLVAVNAANGSIIWNVPSSSSRLLLGNGMIYATSNGKFQGFDINTGTSRWQSATGGTSQPVLKEGVIYMANNTSDSPWAGNLYALDAITGAEKWRLKFDGHLAEITRRPFIGRPIISGDLVYLCVQSRPGFTILPGSIIGTIAVNINSGAIVWQKSLNGIVAAADDTGIYCFAEGGIWKYNKTTGDLLWSCPGLYFSEPTLAGDKIYIASTESDIGGERVISTATGEKLSSVNVHHGVSALWPFVTVIKNGKAYYPTSSGMTPY